MNESFGARLRTERERKHIALQAIAQSTKINIALFEALERDDASRWPPGIFRRAFIRAYAEAIELDPESITREFLERFPDPAGDPPTAPVKSDRVGGVRHDSSPADASSLRLTLADDRLPFAGVRAGMLGDWSRRATAAASDLAIVFAIAAGVFAVTGRFWTPFAIATICYYFGGVVALGNSPGGWLVARPRKAVAVDGRPPRMQPQQVSERLDGTENLRRFKPRPVSAPEPQRIAAPVKIALFSSENTDQWRASIDLSDGVCRPSADISAAP
jgi:transcriptional regulator with XRE-family HTH domain